MFNNLAGFGEKIGSQLPISNGMNPAKIVAYYVDFKLTYGEMVKLCVLFIK